NLHPLDCQSATLPHCRSPFALRARRSLGAYRIPLETGLLIPSVNLTISPMSWSARDFTGRE
ncbi:MAG: hypothetical protein WCD43_15375, partial [Candidatus Acidiferrales bacterium]